MDAPGLVTMRDNLPVVDYSRAEGGREAIERCPTGAIVWVDAHEGVIKGAAAKKIIRHSALPEASS